MKVGFIGLGTMGASMASNLQAGGHELQVSDVRKEAAAPHLKAGAIWKDTPRQVAEGVEVVFTSLPGPKEVEQVALGPDGLIHGMKRGSAYFDLSTNSPALMRRLYPAFKEKGIHVLDAPVSGGPEGAKSRKLALWIGRRPRRLRPLQAGAGRDRRPALLRGPDRGGLGGQARAQLRGLRGADRAGVGPASRDRPSRAGRASAECPRAQTV